MGPRLSCRCVPRLCAYDPFSVVVAAMRFACRANQSCEARGGRLANFPPSQRDKRLRISALQSAADRWRDASTICSKDTHLHGSLDPPLPPSEGRETVPNSAYSTALDAVRHAGPKHPQRCLLAFLWRPHLQQVRQRLLKASRGVAVSGLWMNHPLLRSVELHPRETFGEFLPMHWMRQARLRHEALSELQRRSSG